MQREAKKEERWNRVFLTASFPEHIPGPVSFFSFSKTDFYWSIVSPIQEQEESERAGLKLNIQKTKIIASGPITPWEIEGETVETVSNLLLGAPKSLQMVIAAMKLKNAYSLGKKL